MKKLLVLLTAVALAGGLAFAQSGPDTYVYMSFGNIVTLDPEGVYDTASGQITENIYETLVGYDGESITDFVPQLATEWSASDDGLTWTYTLREGVQFHSGNSFSCKDVEYSIQRILVMADSQSGVWFQSEALLGTDSSWEENDAGEIVPTVTWEQVDNAVSCPDGPDGFTAQFNLPALDPAFFVKLMYNNAGIVDRDWAIANGEWDGTEATWLEWLGADPREGYLHNHASGTGAYRLVSWDGGDVVAERFDGYWGEAPAIRTVLYQVVNEEATRILALQNGDADRIQMNDWGAIETQVRGLPGVTVHESDDWAAVSVGAIHLNQAVVSEDNAINVGSGQLDGSGIPSDFFADINVRRGFAYSFDPQEFLEQLYLGKGTVLTMALPPSFLGYDPGIPTYSYDPEIAEEAFQAAFDGQLWDTGFEMTISYNTGNTVRQTIAEILKANIEDLNPNFRVNTRGIQWADFLQDRNDNKLPISIVGWAPDYADPDNYMWTFYHSTGFYGRLLNFEDAELDQLLLDARTTVNPTEREFLYQQVGRRAHDLIPTITYPSVRPFIITRDNLMGVYRNPMNSGQFLWKDIAKN